MGAEAIFSTSRNASESGRKAKKFTCESKSRSQATNVDEDMQLLLKQLKKHPDMPVLIYTVAVSSIQLSIDNGRHEQGGRYLNQLREIEPLITAKVIRERVNKAIDLIKLPSHLN